MDYNIASMTIDSSPQPLSRTGAGMDPVSIIIPVRNEEMILEKSLSHLHGFLLGNNIHHEIVVTGNGSIDRTNEIGRALASKWEWLEFHEISPSSVGRAFVNGVRNCKYDFVVTQDIDLSGDLDFIIHALDLLPHCHMVVGSKTFGKQRRSPARILGSSFYILATQLVFNLALSDYSMAAKAFRKSAVLPALPYLDAWTGYILELCLYLKRHNCKIVQIGVDCEDHRPSHFNLLHEGFYRYAHLYRSWKTFSDKTSWFHTV
jgi:glycosyltransferase involved in cell wall biosynthesis